MSSIRRLLFIALLLLFATTVCGQADTRQPHIGYLYPAGGRRGSVVQIIAGGQYLRAPTEVYVSGRGVSASVVRYYRPIRNLNKEQRELIQERLKEVRQKRLSESTGNGSSGSVSLKNKSVKKAADKVKPAKKEDASKEKKPAKKEESPKTEEVKMPDHPLLDDLENKSLRELAHIRNIIFAPRKKQQPNRQIDESVLIEITIDPDAAPGNRELRLATKTGLTNPMVFQVGTLPEIRELEPNDSKAYPKLPNLPKGYNAPQAKPLELPVLLNGQIMPGDVDRFRFRGRQGQQLVIEAHARSLIPYLADAVPGWFQATLALYDYRDTEVAFDDDYRFNPDPVLFYKVPKDGEYELEIRDSIYRGRLDFVYRIAVGEQPFITQIFPLGGKAGVKTVASINGWNLPDSKLSLDTLPGDDSFRRTAYHEGNLFSNSILYAVDTLGQSNESESNDTIKEAQRIDLPKIINGRIDRPGDIDVFRFKGRAGEKIVAEVYARRLNSPLDSLLRLTDASGKVLQSNDDYVLKDNHLHKNMMGLVTHHADSYLLAESGADGTYYVHLGDSQNHGGAAFAYRLRISHPQPDFSVCVTPSSLSVRAGGIVPVCVHVLRKDGFDGEVEVLPKDTTAGFEIAGGRIPSGCDRIRMTLKAPHEAPGRPVALQLQGRANISGKTVTHTAVGADDVMQAFLYRHLVPSQELLVDVQKAKWREADIELAAPVKIVAGGKVEVQVKINRKPALLKEMRLELHEPPDGLTLDDVTVAGKGLAFNLKADAGTIKNGFADNVIIEVFREYMPKQKKGKPAPKKQRYSMGFFPAIPIQVVGG